MGAPLFADKATQTPQNRELKIRNNNIDSNNHNQSFGDIL